MKANAAGKLGMKNSQIETVTKHCDELKRLVASMQEYFPKEKSALVTIANHLCASFALKPDSYTREVWKYYRAYKLKEFLFNMRKRIAVEATTVDSMKNKTVNMINDEFLWEMVKEAGGDLRKFAQVIYSEGVLMTKIEEKQHGRLSSALKKNIGEDMVNKTLRDVLEQKGESTFKDLVHAIAAYGSGSQIQLDHVLPRDAVKRLCEKMCADSEDSTDEEAAKIINERVDDMLPWMYGAVVKKDENTELGKRYDGKKDFNWTSASDIVTYVYNNENKVESLVRVCKIEKDVACELEINKAAESYDSIVLGKDKYEWK